MLSKSNLYYIKWRTQIVIEHNPCSFKYEFQFSDKDYIFWADSNANTISRIKRDLTERMMIVDSGISQVEGLAVDWIAGMWRYSLFQKCVNTV